jgi:hypothetical protein
LFTSGESEGSILGNGDSELFFWIFLAPTQRRLGLSTKVFCIAGRSNQYEYVQTNRYPTIRTVIDPESWPAIKVLQYPSHPDDDFLNPVYWYPEPENPALVNHLDS